MRALLANLWVVKGFAVQASLTRLFDTAAIARSRCLLARLALAFLGFPNISLSFPGKIRVVSVWHCSVLSSRRPGQNKNPKKTGRGQPGRGMGGFRGSAFPVLQPQRFDEGSRQETS